MESILKTYPVNNITRLNDYNIWYSDIKADSSITLGYLDILTKQVILYLRNSI